MAKKTQQKTTQKNRAPSPTIDKKRPKTLIESPHSIEELATRGGPGTLSEHLAAKRVLKMDEIGLPQMPIYNHSSPIEISSEVIIALGTRMMSIKQIAHVLGVEEKEITKYSKQIEMAKERSRSMLRDKMLKKALLGDTQMMIWLSKQNEYLAYKESKQESEEKTTINIVTSDMPQVLNDKVIEVKK